MVLIKQVTGNLSGGVTTLAEAHRLPNQTREQINAEPSVRDGLRKRAKTDYLGKFDGDFDNAKFHFVTGSPLFTGGPTKHMLAVKTDGVSAVDLDSGDQLGIYKCTRDSNGFITGGAPVVSADLAYLAENSPDPQKDFQLLTVEDATIVLNKKAVAAKGSTSTTRPDPNDYAYFFCKGLTGQSTQTKGDVTLAFERWNHNNAGTTTYRTTIPQAFAISGTTYTYDTQFGNPADMCSMVRIAFAGENSWVAPTTAASSDFIFPHTDDTTDFPTVNRSVTYNTSGSNSATFKIYPHAVLPIKIGQGSGFIEGSFEAGYSGGDDFVSFFYGTVPSLDSLPLMCHNGKTVKVLGTPTTEYDDYYLTFRTDNGAYWGRGVWEESTSQPWIKYGPDPDTMPHVLVRRQDTTLGTVTGTSLAYYYEWAPMDGTVTDINDGDGWSTREVGDDITNPHPAFFDKTIAAMTVYQGRLAFCTPEGDVCLSEAGKLFNFYRTATLALLDSDPIILTVSGGDAGRYRHLIPFSRELLIVGDNAQFSLNNGGGVVSPATVSIDRVSGYEVSEYATPTVLENTAVFVSQGEARTQVWQMYRENDTAYNAIESSDSIPGYITGTVSGITTSSVVGAYALSNGTQDLLMHSYFRQGNQVVMQSWWKMRVAGASRVNFAYFYGDTLYISATRTTDGGTETVALSYEPDNETVFKADLFNAPEAADLDYITGTGVTEITVPYGISSDDTVFVYNTTDDAELTVQSVTTGASSAVISVVGDVTTKSLVYGIRFDMSVRLHHPTLPIRNTEGSQSPERAARVLINKMDMTYTDTRPFEVKVESPYRQTRTYSRPATLIGNLSSVLENPRNSSGVLELGIHLPTEEADITITDTSPWPVRLENIQWEMSYRARSKTWAGR
jgi:hypothetical protein